MWFQRRRNWLAETSKQELARRVNALEIHVENLEERYAALENLFNELAEEVRQYFEGQHLEEPPA